VDTQTWTEWIRLRTSDIRAIFPTYIAFTFGILTLLTFGHEHLESMQWQTTVIVVIANFWWLLFMDGAIADVAAGAKDMDDDIAQSEMGKLYAKAPFMFFRAVFVVGIIGFTIAELAALYR